MKLHMESAEVFVPDNLPIEQALGRTTHMAISAHQDDIEIMAAQPILECFQQKEKWFSGVVMTDGRGSPRDGLYKGYTDEDMRLVRFKEQRKAAVVGEYAAQIMLDYPSGVIKDPSRVEPVEDLRLLLRAARPTAVFTHNLADKHDTHVATALRTIAAICSLPEAERPEKLYGCEVWRSLDWMLDEDKAAMELSEHESLQLALLGVYDSQISGGKRYDQASMGRRRANATYFESHGIDTTTGLSYAMDMSSLMRDTTLDPEAFVTGLIRNFQEDVTGRLHRLSKTIDPASSN